MPGRLKLTAFVEMLSTRFVIDDLSPESMPAAAAFLAETQNQASDQPSVDSTAMLGSLRSGLLGNPARTDNIPLGHLLRAGDGRVAGVNLLMPHRFLHESKSLVGVCSSSFFVSLEARIQGFFMMRRFLALPGVDFFYATTGNENSGPLWQKLGGRPIADSEYEGFFVLRYPPFVEEVVWRRSKRSRLSRLAGMAGGLATILQKGLRQNPDLSLQESNDWHAFADFAASCRRHSRLTADRSADVLRWRYEKSSNSVFRVRSDDKDVAWFVLGRERRGHRSQIQVITLRDIVWKEKDFDPQSILSLVAQLAKHADHAIVLNGYPLRCCQGLKQLRRHDHGYFRTFVIAAAKEKTQLMAEAFDVVEADGG